MAGGHTVWVWQLGQDYPGAVADDGALPIGRVWLKAFDGLTAQGTFDDHPLGARDGEALARLRAVYARQGITLGVWTVPHGVYPGSGPQVAADPAMRPGAAAPRSYAYREGFAHGAAARAAAPAGPDAGAVLVADVEPSYYGGATPQFWREDRGAGADEVRAYLAGAVAGGAGAVWFSAACRRDGRALRDVAAEAWLADPRVAGLCPQVYWTDFRGGWRDAFRELESALAAVGHAAYPAQRIAPVLPGDARPADLAAAWAYCRDRGFARPSLWRRGTVTAQAWATLAALDWEGEAPPAAPPPGRGGEAAALRAAIGDAHDLVRRAAARLEGALDGERAGAERAGGAGAGAGGAGAGG